ncbi:MAG TPA: hypothetical protein VFQ53_32675 [Kofleriaceae bacterium]|nr:hypothetical protein [Kofleriaceae bacterium]
MGRRADRARRSARRADLDPGARRRQPLTPAQDKRLRSLIAKHRVAWLGELADVVQHREGLVFDRGLLAACQIQVKKLAALDAAIGHPLWAALRSIWFADKFAWDPRIVPLLVDPVMRELREVTCIGVGHVFVALARHPRPLPITSIWTVDDAFRSPADSVQQLATAPGLPALRRLGFTYWGDAPWIVELPIVRRIETLGITAEPPSRVWLDRTRRLDHLTTLELRRHWIPIQGPERSHFAMYFTRGKSGEWSRLRIEPTRHVSPQWLGEELVGLPADSLEHITVPHAMVAAFRKFRRAEIVTTGAPEAPKPPVKRKKR